jgi:hypothetical protein
MITTHVGGRERIRMWRPENHSFHKAREQSKLADTAASDKLSLDPSRSQKMV